MADEEETVSTMTLPEDCKEGQELPPRLLGYVNSIIFLSGYVQRRAALGDVTEEELIEHIGLNIRRTINPEFDATKVS